MVQIGKWILISSFKVEYSFHYEMHRYNGYKLEYKVESSFLSNPINLTS